MSVQNPPNWLVDYHSFRANPILRIIAFYVDIFIVAFIGMAINSIFFLVPFGVSYFSFDFWKWIIPFINCFTCGAFSTYTTVLEFLIQLIRTPFTIPTFANLFVQMITDILSGLISGPLLNIFIFTVIFLLYNSLFESSKHQATPGKMLVGLKTVNEDGSPITFTKALLRSLFFYGISVILPMGPCFSWPFSSKRQCLHDMLTYTSVVQR